MEHRPSPEVGIHTRIAELRDHLEITRGHLRHVVDAVPAGHGEWSPPSGGWTVAEVVHHLARIEAMITGLFVKMVGSAREGGLGPEVDNTLQLDSFHGYRVHNRKHRVTAPERGTPDTGIALATAWSALDASRADLLRALEEADGLALGAISYPHAQLGEMSMYQWVAFVGFHETRHAAQIEEITASLS
ncbi:MAG: DinB family protein [Gemmatimonadales bacterium]